MDKEKTKLKIKDALVRKEKNRLLKLFADIPDNKKKAVDGLIIQAARLRVMLDEAWEDICENGDYELFAQSKDQTPYERERPVAKLFNARDTAYHRVVRELAGYLPSEKRAEAVSAASRDGSDLV